MSWYKVTLLPKDVGIGGKAKVLQDRFEALFMASSAPKDVAMFTNHDEDFAGYFYYFSPGAVTIAKDLIESYSGITCAPPVRDEVNLLVGHSGAREALLLERGNN
jgi:hypothetical protein